MGVIKFTPKNEMQTREWFAAHISESEYDLISSQGAFPDYALRDSDGRVYRVEVEYKSANFIRHGHDSCQCDFVLCWIHNTRLTLPVLELSTGDWYEAGTISELQDLEQQCFRQGRRVRGENKRRKTVKAIKNKNLLLEVIGNKAKSEYSDFILCFADDLRATSKFLGLIAPARAKLWRACEALTIALRESGFDMEDLHPDDLFKLVTL